MSEDVVIGYCVRRDEFADNEAEPVLQTIRFTRTPRQFRVFKEDRRMTRFRTLIVRRDGDVIPAGYSDSPAAAWQAFHEEQLQRIAELSDELKTTERLIAHATDALDALTRSQR